MDAVDTPPEAARLDFAAVIVFLLSWFLICINNVA